MIYLDHNATAPLLPAAREAMLALLATASATRRARTPPVGARVRPSSRRGARSPTCSACRRHRCASPAAPPRPTTWRCSARSRDAAGAHVVASPIEHASVLGPLRELERRGASVSWLPVDAAGRVTADDVVAALRPETALVSVGWANGEIGTLQPIAAIAAVCRARGVLAPRRRGAGAGAGSGGRGAASISAPSPRTSSAARSGSARWSIRRGLALRPLMWGGEQERGLRAGHRERRRGRRASRPRWRRCRRWRACARAARPTVGGDRAARRHPPSRSGG